MPWNNQNTLEFWFMITTWSKKLTFRVIIVKNFPRAFGARLFSYNSLQLEIPWNILENTLEKPWNMVS